MSIDYRLIHSDTPAGVNPPEGLYRAHLAVAKLVHLNNGATKLKTEWQTDQHYWETWHGFSASQVSIANDYLDGLGVNRKNIMSDLTFEAELAKVTGHDYQVRTSNWSGGVNTYIEDTLSDVAPSPDVPINTDFVDRADAVQARLDDDIPF